MEKRLTLNNVPLQLPRQYEFKAKDPVSALTHFIGFGLALVSMPALLIRAAYCGAGILELVGFAVFMLSMVLLYGASTAYHAFHISARADMVLKKLDHMMIFILIAGSYTPICISVLRGGLGLGLLIAVWAAAALGICFVIFWVTCPKWISSVIYISMGWLVIFAARQLYLKLPAGAFLWLLIGGILYTIGGVIYALKPRFLAKKPFGFGGHEVFHLFVLAGSFCHFIMMFSYLAKLC